MSPPPAPPDFPLPSVYTALKPYIHSRPEALHIRQCVTQHLQNLANEKRICVGSGSTDEFNRFVDFELGRRGGGGVRREYLFALRENARARREYEDVAGTVGEADNDDDDDEVEGSGGRATANRRGKDPRAEDQEIRGGGWREDYLSVLKLRRQYERLLVLREYLSTFASGELETAPPQRFNEPPPVPPQELTAKPQNPHQGMTSPSGGIKAAVEPRVLELEKAVLRAHADLESEKHNMKMLRHRQATGGAPRGSRKDGLLKTHDALSAWLEAELSKTANNGGDIDASTIEKKVLDLKTSRVSSGGAGGGGETVESVVDSINTTYESYLSSRRELVELLAATTLPPSPQILTPRTPAPPPDTSARKTIPAPESLAAVVAIEHLLPISHYQKSLLAQKNYLSSTLSVHGKNLYTLLESLCSSSPSSPSSPSPPHLFHNHNNTNKNTTTPTINLAQQIQKTSLSTLHQNNSITATNLRSANEILSQVQILVKEVEESVVPKSKGKDASTKIPTVVKRKKGRKVVETETPTDEEKGLWEALAGGVGVIGDGI